MTSCCACCCFYPKYKRKVDNIYPRSLDAPLVKPEVDKLQYYVQIHPEKLSKIAEYLYQNLKWGLNGTYKNRNYVKNTIEAADKILLAITPQNLNYYATSYLKIIQKLLEQGGSTNSANGTVTTSGSGNLNATANNNLDYLEYQKLAAGMFQKFCEKEASNSTTTSYNLNYDTFVCQFSSMCYNNNKDERIRAEIRSSGLQCLATMVKRLVPDDSLRAGYLWDNMDKIVPALLFIMHEKFLSNYIGSNQEEKDYYESDEFEEDDLGKYIYGGLGMIGGLKSNSYDEQDRLDFDSIKIKFKKTNGSSDNVIGSGIDKSSSEQSSPREGTVMIDLRQNNKTAVQEVIDPDHEAKMLLKNLASKADYTTISKIVIPILTYLDDNKPTGWEYSKFVRCIFLILMYNVKQQHAIVIKELIKHLDSHRNSSAKLKCYIIRAISICIRIAAMHSVGTTGQIIEIFTNLLKHLNFSVEKASEFRTKQLTESKPNLELGQQQSLQREIIAAMGQFTSHLPDYAKNDVIMFIARQINSQQFNYLDLQNKHDTSLVKDQLRTKYFECLHEICTKYKPSQLFSAFTSGQFLEDILRLTLVNDWNSRRKAHEILHLLLDKYQFLNKIKQLKPNLFEYSPTRSSLSSNNDSAIVRIKDNNSKLNKSISTLNNLNDKSLKNATSNLSLNNRTKKVTNELATAGSQKNLKITRNQTYLSQLELNESNLSTGKEDVHFMRKYGGIFLAHLNENLFLANNRRENYESIYLTSCFFLIGLYNEKEFLIDLIRFGFHVQELALLNNEQASFTFGSQCSVHKFIAAYFLLVSKISGIVELQRYCSEICDFRRKKDLFKFVYPEYILLDSALLTDSGIHSASQSLTEIETEFKRELNASAKEYANSIQSKTVDSSINLKDKTKNKNSKLNLNNKKNSTEDQPNACEDFEINFTALSNNKMAPWLFDKKTVGTILENNGFSTTLLFMPNSDYSLSVAYLQQTLASLKTVLRFRSPYSNSYDSIVAFNPSPNDINGNPTFGGTEFISTSNHHAKNSGSYNHHRGFSITGQFPTSPSNNQLGPGTGGIGSNGTPRRSIDAESNTDDGTSYDSVSQISVDQNGFDLNDHNVKFYTENPNGVSNDNQNTVNSLNLLKSQYYQQVHDLSSFETIKRVLFTADVASNLNGSNFSNSGVGGMSGSTIGPNSININASKIFRNVTSTSITDSQDQNSNKLNDQQQPENNTEIISEFKQKPFDELKKKLYRSNQLYLNAEKYQQVFEFISKEHPTTQIINASSHITNGNINGGTASNNNQPNGSNSNLNNSSLSLSNASNQSTSMNSGVSIKESYQQKVFSSNDIEFPQLFMY